MISPEILRHYPWFGGLEPQALQALAMLAERETAPADRTLFCAGDPADALFLLIAGSVDLYYVVVDRDLPGGRREYFLDSLNPGEVFGVAALIAPHVYTLTARTAAEADLVRLEAAGLRALLEQDKELDRQVQHQLIRTLAGRLRETRVLLAAARA